MVLFNNSKIMKEKILILSWILFLSLWVFMYSSDNVKSQYNYNGWLFKNVLAAVVPDSYQVSIWSGGWDNWTDKVTFSLSNDSASSIDLSPITTTPPPRDSH